MDNQTFKAGTADDERKLRDLMLIYCRGVDRLDIDLLRSLYSPDATVHFSKYYEGPLDPSWFETVLEQMAQYEMMQHHVTNSFFRFCGDTAEGETYVLALHTYKPPKAGMYAAGARYLDRFKRVDGVWKISHRTSHVDWDYTFNGPGFEKKESWEQPDTDRDPSYDLLKMFRSLSL